MKKFIFGPLGKDEELFNLISITNELRETLKENNIDFNIKNLTDEIEKRVNDFNKSYKELLDCISQLYGKYIHIKFLYSIYSIGNKQEKWVCDYEANALIYRYIPSNNCLFGVYCVLNNDYVGGIKDTTINLMHLSQGHRVEIEEISKEEFISIANKSLEKCLDNRINKIESVAMKEINN